ncbi:hypothetical protein ARMGADRAFT_1040973, partial [Armillaria gallica]
TAPLLPSLNTDSPDDGPTSANEDDDSVQLEAPILRQDDVSTPGEQGHRRIECSLDGNGGWAKTEKHANHNFFVKLNVPSHRRTQFCPKTTHRHPANKISGDVGSMRRGRQKGMGLGASADTLTGIATRPTGRSTMPAPGNKIWHQYVQAAAIHGDVYPFTFLNTVRQTSSTSATITDPHTNLLSCLSVKHTETGANQRIFLITTSNHLTPQRTNLLVLGVVHGGDWEGTEVLEGDNWTFYEAQQITFYQECVLTRRVGQGSEESLRESRAQLYDVMSCVSDWTPADAMRSMKWDDSAEEEDSQSQSPHFSDENACPDEPYAFADLMASGQLKLHVTFLNDLVPTVAVTALIKRTSVLPESTAHTSSNRTVCEWSDEDTGTFYGDVRTTHRMNVYPLSAALSLRPCSGNLRFHWQGGSDRKTGTLRFPVPTIHSTQFRKPGSTIHMKMSHSMDVDQKSGGLANMPYQPREWYRVACPMLVN